MASPSPTILLPLLSLATLFAIVGATSNLTAYEALETFNFPVGILPVGAVGYDFDETTGGFRAYLNGSCSFSLVGTYDLKYESTVSGTISTNMLSNLSGVSVKVFVFNLDVVQVRRVGDELEFSVGFASRNFPTGNFYRSPQCGCGLDCDDGDDRPVRKIGMRSLSWMI